MTDAMLQEASRASALFDAHRDDPEFGHRFLADEARGAGAVMADGTAWRIFRDSRWWSVSGKKRGKGTTAGPPVQDDLVRRDFTATCANRLWLVDITEHATGEGSSGACQGGFPRPRTTPRTLDHAVGTCAMGPAEDDVVDP
ncbi:hypothetical protein RKE30_20180 [Streptomyces sp. Li-HN-5-11]|uniref:hypothetical protein n=1 Tax=Streptomyces sp. Li-HN-5-11 TaxID=3075432 RepID=UPI0028B0AFA5|nr:hypothetical protein [Streptomyces sp. Li-HN-5-11]WNM32567.1 hypothetical protein RKE30_20180 [Streptomyces sp. Li-HN-5-11]WOP38684.1 hypothetical protein RKE32_35455 [Streptomyces sp. Li-HN-5-13]